MTRGCALFYWLLILHKLTSVKILIFRAFKVLIFPTPLKVIRSAIKLQRLLI